MQKTGQVERTVDREFTDEEAKYKTWAKYLMIRSQTLIFASLDTRRRLRNSRKRQRHTWTLCAVGTLHHYHGQGAHQLLAMAASQARIADTIDKFYGSADRTSEGAMAANAYKRSVDELDSSISRELVSTISINMQRLMICRMPPTVPAF